MNNKFKEEFEDLRFEMGNMQFRIKVHDEALEKHNDNIDKISGKVLLYILGYYKSS